MIPLRSKRRLTRRRPRVQDAWAVRKAVADGKPALVRVHRGVDELCRHPEFQHQLRIERQLRRPNEKGLPTQAEHSILIRLEHHLNSLLGNERDTVHVATVTTGGRCEFVFYTGDPHGARARLTSLIGPENSTIDATILFDPEWTAYRRLADGA